MAFRLRGSGCLVAHASPCCPLRPVVCAVASQAVKQGNSGSTTDLNAAGGWAVEVPGAQPQPQRQQPQKQHELKADKAHLPNGGSSSAGDKPKRRSKRQSTPFVALRSPEAQLGLTILQESLAAAQSGENIDDGLQQRQQPQQQQERQQQIEDSIRAAKDSLSAAGGKRQKQPMAASLPARHSAAVRDDEGELENNGAVPAFALTFGAQGTELLEYDANGRPLARPLAGDEGSDEDEQLWGDDDDDGFGSAGWEQFGGDSRRAVEDEEADGEDVWATESDEVRLLKDITNEDDWGLDALAPGGSKARRPSLLAEIARERRVMEEGVGEAGGGSGADGLMWGGSGGATGIDLEEQEELLSRYFRPHEVKKYMDAQRAIDENYATMKARAAGVGAAERRLHHQLKIIAGSATGRRLLSARGSQTRPMMEKVRAAIFDMVQAQAGSVGGLPQGCRWLDLFAGTGSVGLEALSRGAGEAHFVELDPWVHRRVLGRNIAACGFTRASTCHTTKAEDFLRRAAAAPRFAGGPFDFISVCPPYLLVSYPELYDLLEASGLVHSSTIVFVEYPKQLSEHVRPTLGPLAKVRDRKYGRTWIAVYAPQEAAGTVGVGDDEVGDWGE